MSFGLQIICYIIGFAMIVHYWCVANFLPRSTPVWMGLPIAIVFGAACLLVVSTYQQNLIYVTTAFAIYAFSSVWMRVMLWLHGFRVNQVARSLSKNGIDWDEIIQDLRGFPRRNRSISGIN